MINGFIDRCNEIARLNKVLLSKMLTLIKESAERKDSIRNNNHVSIDSSSGLSKRLQGLNGTKNHFSP